MRSRLLLILASLFLFVGFKSVFAQAQDEESVYDRIWRYGTLYTNDGEGFIRRIALSGRLQWEAAWFDADQGDFDDTTWRRFRFGFVSDFAGDLWMQVEADLDLNQSRSDWYQSLTDAYIGWRPDDSTELKVLKQSAGFTLDGATSSKKLLTLQRNNLTGNLWFSEEYFTGITLAGESGRGWEYKGGVFASDDAAEIGVTDASWFTLASLGRGLETGAGIDEASFRLDYVYNDKDPNANTPDLSQVLSLTTRWRAGSWNMHTDLAWGDGYYDQSDILGVVLMPFYDVTERLQLIGRYTFISSEDDNGLSFDRYEDEIVDGRGDEYHEVYAGVNLFFYGHKLKWQAGVQYTDMSDDAGDGGEYQGWGFTTGLRIYW